MGYARVDTRLALLVAGALFLLLAYRDASVAKSYPPGRPSSYFSSVALTAPCRAPMPPMLPKPRCGSPAARSSPVDLIGGLAGFRQLRRCGQGRGDRSRRSSGRRRTQQRLELRLDRLEELDGHRAREMIRAGDRARHIGGDRAVEPVAEKEDKGSGAIENPLRNPASATTKVIDAVVTGPGLAADRKQIPICRAIDAVQSPRSPLGDNARQRLAHHRGDLRRKNPLRLRVDRHLGVIRGAGGKMQSLQIDRR